MFELREISEFAIIMNYYPLENIIDVSSADNEYVIAWEQILDDLKHLHAKRVIHRDLKSENILIERNSLFKIIIADFGMIKVAIDTVLLQTFCGTLKYAAFEVFSDLSFGHEILMNIFSLSVMIYEWIYDLSSPSNVSTSKKKNEEVSDKQWYTWFDTWIGLLFDKLKNEENDSVIQILICMIETKVTSRWSATKCLAQDFKDRLFKRKVADDLIECANDSDDFDLSSWEREDLGIKTPTAASWLSPGLKTASERQQSVPLLSV